MANITPVWTDDVVVIAAAVLPRGSVVRGELDLRSKHGGKIFVRIGRGGPTALSIGVSIHVRALLNGGAPGGEHPAAIIPRRGQYLAGVESTIALDSAAGQPNLNVVSANGFSVDDVVCIQDSGGGVTRLEFQRIANVIPGLLTMDRNLGFTHTAVQADTVRNKADVFPPMWIPGGSVYETILDYMSQISGESVTVQVMAQTYDSELLV